MTRNDIQNNINHWYNQYKAYESKVKETQQDISNLSKLNGKLNEQLNNFQGYLRKRSNRIRQYAFMAQTSRIANRFLTGMQNRIQGNEARNIVSNLVSSINHINGQIRKLQGDCNIYQSNMNKCAQNYHYWVRMRDEYDRRAAQQS